MQIQAVSYTSLAIASSFVCPGGRGKSNTIGGLVGLYCRVQVEALI